MWVATAGLCAAVLTLAGIFLYLDPQLPAAESYRHLKLETPLRIYTSDDALIAEYGERRLIPITLEEVPPLFVSALLDTEDKRFYEHGGVDYISLVNDTWDLVRTGSIQSGASTITMQLSRNISLSLERTFIRKFKEILLALKLENELGKDEILELYINAVPFGKRAYGAQAAANTYYGKPLDELNLAQLAMLAGIPQAPSAGNPINGPERALNRRNLVLSRMLNQGSIDQAAYDDAVSQPITANVHARDLAVPALFAAEWARQEVIDEFPDLYTGGYEIVTTLTSTLQAAATRAVRQGLMAYDQRHGYVGAEQSGLTPDAYEAALRSAAVIAGLHPAVVTALADDHIQAVLADGTVATVPFETMRWARKRLSVDERGPEPESPADVVAVGDLIRLAKTESAAVTNDDAGSAQVSWAFSQTPQIQGALVSLNPENGAVVALEGGLDFTQKQFNHALQAARQPGSGFKPFVYSAAVENGISPADVYMDAPLVFEDELLEMQYRPQNVNRRYNGPTRLREALYRSINLVSIQVLRDVGAGRVLKHSQNFGFDTSSFPRNTQLAIGGGTMAVTPIKMAQAFAVFANGGYRVEPYIVQTVRTDAGRVLYQHQPTVVCRTCDDEDDAETDAQNDAPEAIAIELLDADQLLNPAPQPLEAPRVLDERNAFIMHSMLQDVIRRGTGARAMRELKRGDLAGKTGTTDDAADTWFSGYSPNLVTTVWAGYDDYQPLGRREFGSTTPLPIWIDYMRVALNDQPETGLPQPPGIVTMKIDPATGEPASPLADDAIFEYFLAEYAPKPRSSDLPGSVPLADDGEIKAVDIF